MSNEQFQHLLNMLKGLQDCVEFVGWCVFWHILLGGTSTGGIKDRLDRIANALQERR